MWGEIWGAVWGLCHRSTISPSPARRVTPTPCPPPPACHHSPTSLIPSPCRQSLHHLPYHLSHSLTVFPPPLLCTPPACRDDPDGVFLSPGVAVDPGTPPPATGIPKPPPPAPRPANSSPACSGGAVAGRRGDWTTIEVAMYPPPHPHPDPHPHPFPVPAPCARHPPRASRIRRRARRRMTSPRIARGCAIAAARGRCRWRGGEPGSASTRDVPV